MTSPPEATPGERYRQEAVFGYMRRYALGLIDETDETDAYAVSAEIAPITQAAQVCEERIVARQCSKWVFVEESDCRRKLFPRDLHDILADSDRPALVPMPNLGDLHAARQRQPSRPKTISKAEPLQVNETYL